MTVTCDLYKELELDRSWQINKTYVTGQMGTGEQIVSTIGDYAARFGGWLLRFIVKAVLAIFKFVLWLCTGGPFR